MPEYLFFSLVGLFAGSTAYALARKLSNKPSSFVHFFLAKLAGALVALACLYRFDSFITASLMLFFFTLLFFLSLSDIYTFTIPDIVPTLGTIAGLSSSLLRPDFSSLDSTFGILLALLLSLPLYLYSTKVKKAEALGFGDVQVLVFIGSFTGPWGVLYAKILGSLLAFLYALPTIVKYKNARFLIPFVPFLSSGTFIGIVTDLKTILLTF